MTNAAEDGFRSLTAAQRSAVEHVDGPLLVLAGPGSGKTRVVTFRVAHLIRQGIDPRSILAMTFTNKAADEMKERLQAIAPGNWVWMGTFHRFCSRLLRRHAQWVGLDTNFTIYDTDDSRRALRLAIEQANLPLAFTGPDRLAHQISWLKNRLVTPDEYEPRPGYELGPILKVVYPLYQQRLLAANAVDFDDLLMHTAKLLQQHPELRADLDSLYRYILVDEYQDTNLAQYAIVRSLSVDHPNLSVTGDPDQAIYGWRGADINNILSFEKDYPGAQVVRLEQNYRSTPNILRVADALIGNNQRRKAKQLITDNPEGAPVRLICYPSARDEAEGIVAQITQQKRLGRRALRDFVILYRANWLSRTIEYSLRDAGLPYQIVHGVEFYQRAEIKDMIAYLQAIYNPRDDVSVLRIINVPPRRLGRATIQRVQEHADEQGLSLLEAARAPALLEKLTKATRDALSKFAHWMDQLSQTSHRSVAECLQQILDESGYWRSLEESEAPEDQDRLDNLRELISAATEYDQRPLDPERAGDPLGAFLEHVALVNDVDDWDQQTDRVTLMTLHAAKGLEFPVVFIVGVEQGLLPHDRSLESNAQIEEERRLLFVGITRAQHELQISYAEVRNARGSVRRTIPSMFLVELPRDSMDLVGTAFAQDDTFDAIDPPDAWDDVYVDDADTSFDVDSFDHGTADACDSDIDSIPDDRGEQDRASTEGPVRVGGIPRAPITENSIRTAANVWQANGAATPPSSAPDSLPPVDPQIFRVGMAVIHPRYGPGKIATLSGQGNRRTAHVHFATAGQKTFVLAMSPLRPVGKPGP